MAYLPEDDRERKDAPMFRGLMGYFPAALFEVAAHSLDSDRKHNPGSTTGPNWARGKSADHEDCIIRHVIDAGPRRSLLSMLPAWLLAKMPGSSARDAKRYHLRCLAWRALALLQEDCEATGAADGVSCIRSAPADVPRPAEHPAQVMARDAALAEEVRGEFIRHGRGARARVYAIKLARVRLGVGLGPARDWVDIHVPESKVKKT
jgi:hypothetical protein